MAIFRETKVRFSILLTLTLLFVCIGVIPLLISNWKLISINREELDKSLRENFINITSTVSIRIADYVNGCRELVLEYAPRALDKLQGRDDPNEPPALMKRPSVLKVRILNLQGKGPYAQKFNFQDPAIPDLEFMAFREASHGRTYLSAPYYSGTDDLPVLVIAEPLYGTDGRPAGVLSVIFTLEPLFTMINEQSAGGKKVYVVDSRGNLLLHPVKTEMQASKNLSNSAIVQDYLKTLDRLSTVRPYREKQGDKTVEILASYEPVADLKWGVIVQIEKDIALAPINAMIRESAQWGILFALAAALLGIYLARRITRPVQVLAEHALDIGRNHNFDRKIDIRAGNEIQQLAETFNYMTDEIKQYIISLENAARENKELFMSSIRMLAAAIDAKDPYTRGHSERVKDYALVIAKTMGFTPAELERVEIGALLHDVGKIGIDDRILRKPTNLTPEEFEIMKTHPDKGANILSQIAQLGDIVPGTRAHHENYDGSGYPQGLKGEEIPLLARVITIADTFDAMTTDRPYQKAFTLEFALNRIRSMANVKYDPVVVDSFVLACEEGKVTLHKPSRPRTRQPVA